CSQVQGGIISSPQLYPLQDVCFAAAGPRQLWVITNDGNVYQLTSSTTKHAWSDSSVTHIACSSNFTIALTKHGDLLCNTPMRGIKEINDIVSIGCSRDLGYAINSK